MAAGGVLVDVLVVLMLFVVAQRSTIEGVAGTGLKG
jgi:hypothetical protein